MRRRSAAAERILAVAGPSRARCPRQPVTRDGRSSVDSGASSNHVVAASRPDLLDPKMSEPNQITCSQHGLQDTTYVCHRIADSLHTGLVS
jgi:hypothetical protein